MLLTVNRLGVPDWVGLVWGSAVVTRNLEPEGYRWKLPKQQGKRCAEANTSKKGKGFLQSNSTKNSKHVWILIFILRKKGEGVGSRGNFSNCDLGKI